MLSHLQRICNSFEVQYKKKKKKETSTSSEQLQVTCDNFWKQTWKELFNAKFLPPTLKTYSCWSQFYKHAFVNLLPYTPMALNMNDKDFPPPPLWITYTSFLREKMLLQSANRFAAALWFAAVPCFPCTEPTHISTASFLTYRSNLVLLRGKASSYLSKIFHFVTVLPGIVSSKSLGTKCSWAEYITHSWSINEVFKNVS